MGFECGFKKIKRVTENSTPLQLELVDDYLRWAKESDKCDSYIAFESYYNIDEKVVEDNLNSTLIKLYRPVAEANSESYTMFEYLDNWCSDGRVFDDDVVSILGSECVEPYSHVAKNFVTKEKLAELICLCSTKLLEDFKNFKVAFPMNSVVSFEENELKISPCDGIELQGENGEIYRVTERDLEYGPAIFVNKLYDDWTHDAWESLLETCIRLYKTTDFDNELILYYRSW